MRRIHAPPLPLAGLHLLVLTSFAVAQPLFDLLGRNGEFFAARGSTRWEVVLFALGLALLPPALLLGLETLTPSSARGALHAVLVAALIGLLVLQGLRGASGPGWLLVACAGLVGLAGAALYTEVSAARLVVTVLAPAPLLFVALFLFSSEVSRLTLAGAGKAYAAAGRASAPTILVVFDELPVNSLRDARGQIDAVRFPHFAALARGSTWFVDATTVAEGTTHAAPAILTGRYPRAGELPVYNDHPQNVFTLLGGSTRLHAFDKETHLCPPRLCPDTGSSFGGTMGTLAEDTGVVYLHELLPDDLARGIPSIQNGWDGFLSNRGKDDASRRFRPFLASLRSGPRPAFWYTHVFLPHSPWDHLPSGQAYSLRQPPGWGPDEVWTDDQAAVDQYWQRHLLQTGYTDRLLGELVARLRATGLYDRSLLVVTADHGVSFRAGEKRRPLSERNLEDIAYVPLFVKLPRQRRGRVVRAPARTIDVLPTVAKALRVKIPWHVDGRSLFAGAPRERNVVLIKDGGRRFVVPAEELEARRERALRRQLALFGSDEPPGRLFGIGRYRKLLGRPLRTFGVSAGPTVRLDAVDRGSSLVQVSGVTDPSVHDTAVAAGGRVVAVVPAAEGRFWALVPRASLRELDPRIFAIEGNSALRRLRG